jgi:hypothetical protein
MFRIEYPPLLQTLKMVGIVSLEQCAKLWSTLRYAFATYMRIACIQKKIEFLKRLEFIQKQSRAPIQQALGAEAEIVEKTAVAATSASG